MTHQLVLDYLPTDQNTYFQAERSNRYMAAKIKKNETERVWVACREQQLQPITKPVSIVFIWKVPNLRKDPDNVCFAKKFLLDGLVMAGVLKNDTMAYVKSFKDDFIQEKKEGVWVFLIEK